MKFRNRYLKYVLPVVAVTAPAITLAGGGGTDYDAITAAVDWADVITGIAAIAALVAAVKVVKAGVRMLLGMIRG